MGHGLRLIKFLWWDHKDIMNYVVVCSGILYPIIAVWECTPPIITRKKTSLSYRVKVSRYSATYISDHLY